MHHEPVLLTEAMDLLAPAKGEAVLDCTVGLGGHASAFLGAIGESGRLTGLDADAENLRYAQTRLSAPNVVLHHGNFRDLASLALPPQDVIFADLGLSSPHVDDASRGFTFRNDAPLDMRFNRDAGETAAEMLQRMDAEEISAILHDFGELRQTRRLAQALSASAAQTTGDVRTCTEAVFGFRAPRMLPQIFQALRIAVNDEIGALRALLETAPSLLAPGGRMGVISYHSLEDRMVKVAMRALATPVRSAETGAVTEPATYVLRTRKPVVPSEEEAKRNPRSRSAKFRILERCLPPTDL